MNLKSQFKGVNVIESDFEKGKLLYQYKPFKFQLIFGLFLISMYVFLQIATFFQYGWSHLWVAPLIWSPILIIGLLMYFGGLSDFKIYENEMTFPNVFEKSIKKKKFTFKVGEIRFIRPYIKGEFIRYLIGGDYITNFGFTVLTIYGNKHNVLLGQAQYNPMKLKNEHKSAIQAFSTKYPIGHTIATGRLDADVLEPWRCNNCNIFFNKPINHNGINSCPECKSPNIEFSFKWELKE